MSFGEFRNFKVSKFFTNFMFRQYNEPQKMKKKNYRNTFKIFFQMTLKLSNKIIVFTIVTNTILSQIWIKF